MQILALVAGGMMLFAIWPMQELAGQSDRGTAGRLVHRDLYFGSGDAVRADVDLVSAVAGGTHRHKVRSVNRHLPVSAVYTLVSWLGRSSISSIII